jgi:hypothetical protein
VVVHFSSIKHGISKLQDYMRVFKEVVDDCGEGGCAFFDRRDTLLIKWGWLGSCEVPSLDVVSWEARRA